MTRRSPQGGKRATWLPRVEGPEAGLATTEQDIADSDLEAQPFQPHQRGLLRSRRLVGADAAFVRQEARDENRRPVVRGVSRFWRGHGKKWLRGGTFLLLALVAGLAVFVGGAQSGAKAEDAPGHGVNWIGSYDDEVGEGPNFLDSDTWCHRGKSLQVENPDVGFWGVTDGTDILAEPSTPASTAPTALKEEGTVWEQRSVAGTYWTTYGHECLSAATAMVWIADQLLAIPEMVATASIYFFQWSVDGNIADQFLGPLKGKGGDSAFDIFIEATASSFIINFISLVLVIAAVILFWRAIIKGEGLADFLSKFIIMILVAGFLFLFSSNASSVVGGLNHMTNGMVGSVFGAFSTVTCRVQPGVTKAQCEEDAGSGKIQCPNSNPDAPAVPTRPIQCISQVFYHAMIFTPWATGMAGPLNDPTPYNDPRQPKLKTVGERNRAYAYRILEYQSFTRGEMALNRDADKNNNIYAGSLRYSHQFAPIADDKTSPTYAPGGPEKTKKELRAQLLIDFGGGEREFSFSPCEPDVPEKRKVCEDRTKVELNDNWQRTSHTDLTSVVEANHEQDRDAWFAMSGENGWDKIIIALITLLLTGLLSLVIFIIGGAYLVLQLASIILALIAPIAILLGLIPGAGFRAFLKWAELFIGTFIKRIGLAVFVGLIMALYTFLLTLGMSYFIQILLCLFIALVFLLYTGRILEMMELGGVTEGLRSAARFGWGAGRFGARTGGRAAWRGGRGFAAGHAAARHSKTQGGSFLRNRAASVGGFLAGATSTLNPLRRVSGATRGQQRRVNVNTRAAQRAQRRAVGRTPTASTLRQLDTDFAMLQGTTVNSLQTGGNQDAANALNQYLADYQTNQGQAGYTQENARAVLQAARNGTLRHAQTRRGQNRYSMGGLRGRGRWVGGARRGDG